MAKACVDVPGFKKSNGEKVVPILWRGLYYMFKNYIAEDGEDLSKSARDAATDIYRKTILEYKEIFKRDRRFHFDQYDNVTLLSLINNTSYGKQIDRSIDIKNALSYAYGFTVDSESDIGPVEEISDNPVVFDEDSKRGKNVLENVKFFNESPEIMGKYVAKVHRTGDNNFYVTVEDNIKHNDIYDSNTIERFSNRLYKQLRNMLLSLRLYPSEVNNAINNFEKYNNSGDNTPFAFVNELLGYIKLLNGTNINNVSPIMALMADNIFKTGKDSYIDIYQRLIDDIRDKSLASDILGDAFDFISDIYSDNEDMVNNIAAAFVILKRMNKNAINDSINKNIVERCVNTLNRGNLIGNITEKNIIDAITDSDMGIGIANSFVDDYDNIKEYYESNNKSKGIDKNPIRSNNRIIKDMVEAQARQTQLMQMRLASINTNIDEKSLKERKIVQRRLDRALKSGDTTKRMIAIQSFVEQYLIDGEQYKRMFDNIAYDDAKLSLHERTTRLIMIKDYIAAVDNVIYQLQADYESYRRTGNSLFDANINEQLTQIRSIAKDMANRYMPVAKASFIELAKRFLPDDFMIVMQRGPRKGQAISIEEYFDNPIEDISMIDYWLDSMGQSKSISLNIFDSICKQQKTLIHQKSIEDTQFVLKLAANLEKATGSRDTSFMFERDSEGNIDVDTYISDFDRDEYNRRRDDEVERLNGLYGDPRERSKEDWDNFNDELEFWENANTTKTFDKYTLSVRRPDPKLYPNKEFNKLSPAKKEYYYGVMYMKNKKDSLLASNSTTLTNSVKIRKDYLERIRNVNNPKELLSETKTSIKDSVMIRSDDTEFGINTTVRDFEGREVKRVPIYYTRMLDEDNPKDMSVDVTSAMCLYCNMANSYDKMNEVASTLEVMRTFMKSKDLIIKEQKAGKDLVETLKTSVEKIKNVVRLDKSDSRLISRLDAFMDMQVYNRMMKNNTVGNTKISTTKTAGVINQFVALSTTAVNMLSNVSNIASGLCNLNIDMLCGDHFTFKDFREANSIFFTEVRKSLSELGNPIKTNKLDLFNQYYELTQDIEKRIRNVDYIKTKFERVGKRMFFGGNELGEYFLHIVPGIALGQNAKERLYKAPPRNATLNDKEFINERDSVSLWDAYDVEYLDPSNHSAGARLVMKPNLYLADGRRVVTKQELKQMSEEMLKDGKKVKPENIVFNKGENLVSEYDVINYFKNKVADMNHNYYGMYNDEEKNVIQQYSIGILAIMYRKWIRPSLNRRFGNGYYNFNNPGSINIGENESKYTFNEGYYKGAGRFLVDVYKDSVEARRIMLSEDFKKLSDPDKQKIKKCFIESMQFLFIVLSASILEGLKDPKDDDDDEGFDDTKMFDYIEYFTVRLRSELGALAPVSFLTPNNSMLKEALSILNEPIVGMSTWNRVNNLWNVVIPGNWFEEMQSGPYKGKSKAYKSLMEAIPMWRTMRGNFNPEERTRYYENLR